jgi:release factor glutamine methyltransferase
MLILKELLERTTAFFQAKGIPSPRMEAELILAHALKVKRMDIYMQFDRPMAEADLDPIRAMVKRRGQREPLGWITGSVGFHEIDVLVHPGVLVPRPDTETLVNATLKLIPEEGECFVADICCGTGCVGLALAVARPELKLYATDLSPEALGNTKANVAALGLTGRVAVLQGDLLAPIPAERPVDIVVCNPPYIATKVLAGLEPEVATHEPALALDGGTDGLDTYRRLIPAAAARARQAVLVEIGFDQAPAVSALFAEAGLADVQVHSDLGGRDRVVSGRAEPGIAT